MSVGETDGASVFTAAKLAVKSWLPLDSRPISSDAIPFGPTVAVPRIAPLSMNVTCAPVMASGAATNADSSVPEGEAVSETVRATKTGSKFAGAFDTVTVCEADVLAANGPFALKAAVNVCVPALKEAVLYVAVPLDCSPEVPRYVEPSKNDAPPKGTPEVEETCAVSVITAPAVGEPGEAEIVVVVESAFTLTLTAAEVLAEKTAAVYD